MEMPRPRPADFANPFSPGKVGCFWLLGASTALASAAASSVASFFTFSDPPFQFKFMTSSKLKDSTFLTISGAALPKLGIAGG